MSCCSASSCPGTDRFFTRWARKYAKTYRKSGPDKAQRMLLDAVRRVRNDRAELLDIGCGVGALHLTLLQEGATRATGVDVSEGMLKEAKRLAWEQGFSDRTEYILDDFTRVSDAVADADITMMDKVVCCYEQVDVLVEHSLRKTRRILALTHPRESFVVRLGFFLQITFCRLFRSAFRPYWHDWEQVRAMITAQGFKPVYAGSTFFWDVLVFQRS